MALDKNIDDLLSQGKLPFHEVEKNSLAFKGMFGILNSSTFKQTLDNETFGKSFNIYNEDIIAAPETIPQSTSDFNALITKTGKTRELSRNYPTDFYESYGSIEVSDTTGTGANTYPNLEYVLVPLTLIENTENQAYCAFDLNFNGDADLNMFNDTYYLHESEDGYNGIAVGSAATLFTSQSKRLKNFISPYKFGAGYTFRLFETSDGTATGNPAQNSPISHLRSQPIDAFNKQHGGLVFDYKEGVLHVMAQTHPDGSPGQQPNLSGYNHPLYLAAYRYIGPTGSGGGLADLEGTNVVSSSAQLSLEPQVTSEGDLTFNTGESVNLNTALARQHRIEFGTAESQLYGGPSHFARDNARLSSSILIMTDADSVGRPYVSESSHHGLFVNTVHGSNRGVNDLGYFIGFSSSINNPINDDSDVNIHSDVITDKEGSNQSFGFFGPSIRIDAYDPAHKFDENDDLEGQSSEDNDGDNFPLDSDIIGGKFEFRYYPLGAGFNNKVANLYYTPIKYNPSGKTSGSIANELRDLINTNCIQHVSASVTIENGIPRLQVEQVYAGFPTYPYTNPSNFTYNNSSSTHDPVTITGLSILPTLIRTQQVLDSGTVNPSFYTASSGEFTSSLIIPPEHIFTGSNYFNTSTFTSQNRWRGDVVGWPVTDAFDFKIKGVSPLLGVSLLFNTQQGSISQDNVELFINKYYLTQSGNPYNQDTTLVNGKVGPLNPTAGSIASEILRVTPYIYQRLNYFESSPDQVNTFVGFFQQKARFINKSKELPYPTIEMLSGSFTPGSEPSTLESGPGLISKFGHASVYETSEVGGQQVSVNISASHYRSSTVEAFPETFLPQTVTENFVDINITGDANIEGTLTLSQTELRCTASNAISSSYTLSSSYADSASLANIATTAITASHAESLKPNLNITASIISASIITASSIEASTYNLNGISLTTVDVEQSSITGDTSFGSSGTPSGTTHIFTGSVGITGSAEINGPLTATSFAHIDGSGIGFPFNGAAVITGSLEVSGSDSYIGLSDSNTSYGGNKLYSSAGTLKWGSVVIATSDALTGLTQLQDDPSPTLGGELILNGKTMQGGVGSSLTFNNDVLFDTVILNTNGLTLAGSNISQTEGSTTLSNTIINGTFTATDITASGHISASGNIIGNVIGTSSFASNVDLDNLFPLVDNTSLSSPSTQLPINNQVNETYITESKSEYQGKSPYLVFNGLNEDGTSNTYYQRFRDDTNLFHIDFDVEGYLGNKYFVTRVFINYPMSIFRHKSVQISGSNDALNWTGIAKEPTTEGESNHDFSFTNTNPYRWYRATFTNSEVEDGGQFTSVYINEIKYYGFAQELTNNFTGNLTGTSSFANSSSAAISSSYALSSSFVESSSYALSSSFVESASFSTTSSFVESASFSTTSSYTLSSSYSITASYAENAKSTIWYDSTSYATSSVDILITGSLKVTGSSTIGTSGFTSPNSSLTVDSELLVFNPNSDTLTPKGIFLKTLGSDGNNTSGRIIFDDDTGFSINYNGGVTNDILDLHGGMFSIVNGNGSNLKSITIDTDNRISLLGSPNSDFDVKIGESTGTKNKVLIDSHLKVGEYASINADTPTSGDYRLVVNGKISSSGEIKTDTDITGSGLLLSGLTEANQDNIITYNSESGNFFFTSSEALRLGDDLGSHTASKDLDLGSFSLKNLTNITSSGIISSSNDIISRRLTTSQYVTSNNITSSNNVSASNNVIAKNIIADDYVTATNITASGHISASGNITASNLHVDGIVNVDTGITFKGLSFLDATALVSSGSTVFGDEIDIDTHQFTGSVSMNSTLSIPGHPDVSASLSNVPKGYWELKGEGDADERIETSNDVRILGYSPFNQPSLEVQGTIKADKLFLGEKSEPYNTNQTFIESLSGSGVLGLLIAANPTPSNEDTDVRLVISNTDQGNILQTNTLKFEAGGAGTNFFNDDLFNMGKITAGRDNVYAQNIGAHDSNLQFYTAINNVDVERMRITHEGKIGIGTSTPSKTLTVTSNDNATDVTDKNLLSGEAGTGVLIHNSSTFGYSYANLDFRSNTADGRIAFQNTGFNVGDFHFITDGGQSSMSSKMILTNDGELGVGEFGTNGITPSESLHVKEGNVLIEKIHNPTLIIDSIGGTNKDSIIDFRENTVPRSLIYWDGAQNDFVISSSIGDLQLLPKGNVGIGVTAPQTKLHVLVSGSGEQIISTFENSANEGETKASIQLKNHADVCSAKVSAHRTGANYGADLTFELSDDVDGSFRERMRITETGNVGIGTASPTSSLHIHSTETIGFGINPISQSISASLLISHSSGHGQLAFDSNEINHFGNNFYINSYSTSSAQGNINFRAAANLAKSSLGDYETRLYISASGNVGIGTITPKTKLHVNNGTVRIVSPSSETSLELYNTKGDSIFNINHTGDDFRLSNNKDTDHNIIFGVNKDNTVYNNKVGIQTSNPTKTLTVKGDISASGDLFVGGIEENATTTYKTVMVDTASGQFYYTGSYGGGGSNDITIPPIPEELWVKDTNSQHDGITTKEISHNVGIGTASHPTYRLHVDGIIASTNDIIAFSNSDNRLKDNVKPIKNPIEKIKQIGGYTFDWNNNQNVYQGEDVGVIAQEIEKVLPSLVQDKENGYKGVKYDKIVPLLIEAIKDQQNQIDKQGTTIKQLQDQIKKIN